MPWDGAVAVWPAPGCLRNFGWNLLTRRVGAIWAGAVTIMDGDAVGATTTVGRAIVIAVGIKTHAQRGRLGWRPPSFPATSALGCTVVGLRCASRTGT